MHDTSGPEGRPLTAAGDGELQFDSVVPAQPVEGRVTPGVVCAVCQSGIPDEYFEVNGHVCCGACRVRLLDESAASAGAGTFVRAWGFGAAAAVAGAVLYYGVIAITNVELGLVAIAIGYMVGYAVRAGTGGRGGRRFQILAVLLTYFSVSLAYAMLAVFANDAEGAVNVPVLLGLLFVFPVLVVYHSLPGGLLSAAIIAFGMQQAWQMTKAPALAFTGPYRIADRAPALAGGA